MKMGFLTGAFFWGIVLILFGISIILKALFHIDIPVVKVLVAMFLIYLGITILVGKNFMIRDKSDAVFEANYFRHDTNTKEYSVLFGSGTMDLRDISPTENNVNAEASVVFGDGKVIIKKGMPVVMHVTSAFGEARMPNGSTINFGESYYKSESYLEGQPCIKVKASVVFGKLEIMEY